MNNVEIEMTESTKFLGVIIDQNLNFRNHLNYMKGKISRSLGILYKARKIFDKSTLLTLYNSFVHPLFMYCICVWGNAPDIYLNPLVTLQKRAARVIAGAKRIAHSAPIFKELKILNMKKCRGFFIFNSNK